VVNIGSASAWTIMNIPKEKGIKFHGSLDRIRLTVANFVVFQGSASAVYYVNKRNACLGLVYKIVCKFTDQLEERKEHGDVIYFNGR
jgi:hypothetical protein